MTQAALASKVTYDEQCAGVRAPFHVYYRTRAGKLRFAPAYVVHERNAADRVVGMIQTMSRYTPVVERVVATTPVAGLAAYAPK